MVGVVKIVGREQSVINKRCRQQGGTGRDCRVRPEPKKGKGLTRQHKTTRENSSQGSVLNSIARSSRCYLRKGIEQSLRFNPSGSTPRKLEPRPAGGWGSVWGRIQGRITFPPLAERQAMPKQSSKRPRFPRCSFQAPRSRGLQYSRGVIPRVQTVH